MNERKNKKEKSKTKGTKKGKKIEERSLMRKKPRSNDDDNKVIAYDHNLGSWEGKLLSESVRVAVLLGSEP